MPTAFISKSINSLADWSDYLKAKGYTPIAFDMCSDGGYYAELPYRTANRKDFTQVLRGNHSDWVRIGRLDLSNSSILNS